MRDDRLFWDDLPDWTDHAWIHHFRMQYSLYADGYREGASVLAARCKEDRTLNDILIFPIVFLYRQYLELRLKELIIGSQYCLGESKSVKTIHDLSKLWNQCRQYLTDLGEDTSDEDFENTDRLITEFCAVDPFATGFRYPVNKNGEASLSLTLINIQNFDEVMDRVANFLDALADLLAHMSDVASEMYSEFLANVEW